MLQSTGFVFAGLIAGIFILFLAHAITKRILPILTISSSFVFLWSIADCCMIAYVAHQKENENAQITDCEPLIKAHANLFLQSRYFLFAFYLIRNEKILKGVLECVIHPSEQFILKSLWIILQLTFLLLINLSWGTSHETPHMCHMDLAKALKYCIYGSDIIFNIVCALLFLIPLRHLSQSANDETISTRLHGIIYRDAIIISVQCGLVLLAVGATLVKSTKGHNYLPTMANHLVVSISLVMLNVKMEKVLQICQRKNNDEDDLCTEKSVV